MLTSILTDNKINNKTNKKQREIFIKIELSIIEYSKGKSLKDCFPDPSLLKEGDEHLLSSFGCYLTNKKEANKVIDYLTDFFDLKREDTSFSIMSIMYATLIESENILELNFKDLKNNSNMSKVMNILLKNYSLTKTIEIIKKDPKLKKLGLYLGSLSYVMFNDLESDILDNLFIDKKELSITDEFTNICLTKMLVQKSI